MSPRAAKSAPRAPRQQKTDLERAQERLGIEQRRVERAQDKHKAAQAAADEANRELARAPGTPRLCRERPRARHP